VGEAKPDGAGVAPDVDDVVGTTVGRAGLVGCGGVAGCGVPVFDAEPAGVLREAGRGVAAGRDAEGAGPAEIDGAGVGVGCASAVLARCGSM